MKRLFKRLILVAVAVIFAGKAILFWVTSEYGVSGETLISGMHVRLLSELTGREQMEDAGMQIVYQLARRSVVKVAVKDSVGSGIVWKIDDENIVIVSSRHLLMKDVKAKVTFCNEDSADAEVIGYSQQYDIGFLRVGAEGITSNILRDIYEAVPAEYMTGEPDGAERFNDEYADRPVLQIGADLNGKKDNFSTGNILGIGFEPVFNTNVLRTKCYSKAGMSGGGVFDAGGRLLGMLSGGEVAEDAVIREAEITYSIPVALIADEYDMLNNR